MLPNGQISQCKLSKRSSHNNARNSYYIRYNTGPVYFAEVQFYFSINLYHIHKQKQASQVSDSESDSDTETTSASPLPIHNLAYVRLLPYECDGDLLYTTKVRPFQVIDISNIQELVGLIKNKQRLYIVNGYISTWAHLVYNETDTEDEDPLVTSAPEDVSDTTDALEDDADSDY